MFKQTEIVDARIAAAITAELPTHHPARVGERCDLPRFHPLAQAGGQGGHKADAVVQQSRYGHEEFGIGEQEFYHTTDAAHTR